MMGRKILCGLLAAVGFAAQLPAPPARAMGYDSLTCEELGQRRTEMLHSAGVCFKGEREIKAYGNEKCSAQSAAEAKLTDMQRRDIGLIEAVEARKSCP